MTALKHPANAQHQQDFTALTPILATLARVLLSCAIALATIMPWTEHFYTLDRFLRGGQDLELTLLAVLTFLCMILVFSQQGRRSVQRLLSLQFLRDIVPDLAHCEAVTPSPSRIRAAHNNPCPCALPLQI